MGQTRKIFYLGLRQKQSIKGMRGIKSSFLVSNRLIILIDEMQRLIKIRCQIITSVLKTPHCLQVMRVVRYTQKLVEQGRTST